MDKPKYRVSGFYVTCESREYFQTTLRSALGFSDPKRVKKYALAFPDLDAMLQNLEDACNTYDREGYDIEAILPLNIGSSDEYTNKNGGVVTTASYSVTRGAMLVGKRREEKK